MENTYILTSYQAPAACVIDIDFDAVFCTSGTHEGFTEENWDDFT